LELNSKSLELGVCQSKNVSVLIFGNYSKGNGVSGLDVGVTGDGGRTFSRVDLTLQESELEFLRYVGGIAY